MHRGFSTDFPLIFLDFPTSLGPRTRITHGLQSLMGCTLPHDALQVPTLLVVVAHHYQHGHHNSANIVSTTMLRPFSRSFVPVLYACAYNEPLIPCLTES